MAPPGEARVGGGQSQWEGREGTQARGARTFSAGASGQRYWSLKGKPGEGFQRGHGMSRSRW